MHYIMTQLISATPALRYEFPATGGFLILRHGDTPTREQQELLLRNHIATEGYLLDDRLGTWIPKQEFEHHSLPVTVNPNLDNLNPSVSEEMVDDFITDVRVFTLGDKTTVVQATLRNGFTLVESSSCVSPENYDVNIGLDCCMEKIRDKVWFLLGFLLQTAVNGVEGVKRVERVERVERGVSEEMVDEFTAVVKDLIRAGKTYWLGSLLQTAANGVEGGVGDD